MKKLIALVLSLMLFLPVVALGEGVAGEIVIGIYEPASGINGAGGKQETLGIYYANAVAPTVKLSDGIYTVKLVEVDNQSSNDSGLRSNAAGFSRRPSRLALRVRRFHAAAHRRCGRGCHWRFCTNPQVTAGNPCTTAFATWIPSRARCWPTSPLTSSAPKRPIPWPSWAMTMMSAWRTISPRLSRPAEARSPVKPSRWAPATLPPT